MQMVVICFNREAGVSSTCQKDIIAAIFSFNMKQVLFIPHQLYAANLELYCLSTCHFLNSSKVWITSVTTLPHNEL